MTDDIPFIYHQTLSAEQLVSALLLELTIVDLLWLCDMAESKSEAKRLIKQGGVRFNNMVITDPRTIFVNGPEEGCWLSVGKRKRVAIYKGNLPLKPSGDWVLNEERVELWREEVEKKWCENVNQQE